MRFQWVEIVNRNHLQLQVPHLPPAVSSPQTLAWGCKKNMLDATMDDPQDNSRNEEKLWISQSES